jgi:hypothetical protein
VGCEQAVTDEVPLVVSDDLGRDEPGEGGNDDFRERLRAVRG